MGCICSKGNPPEEQSEVKREKSTTKSSRRHVASSRREVVTIIDMDSTATNDGGTIRLLTKSREDDVTPPPFSVKDVKSKTPTVVIVDGPKQQKLIAHQRRATVDVGDAEPVLRIVNVPNGFEAGWPSWLISVAAEAVKGWVPRRADTFEKLDKIGQGTYSSVYRARDLETGKIVALKKVRFVNMDPESVRFMAREIHILRRLDHPNIVKLEGLITSRMSATLYLVFEYMEHDLAGLAATPGIKFTESQVKCYMKQLLDGLEHCHSHGILHRDIKGSNLLIDDNGILRIADFGLATPFTPDQKQPLTSRVVTLWYRPPELLLGATEYGVAVDLWSTGCILAELLAGKPIMPGRTEVEQMHKIFKLCGSPSEEYWRKSKLPHSTIFKPQRPYRRCLHETFKDFPPSALSLIDTLLAIKPEDRGTATSALNSSFFTTKPYACDPSSLPKYPPSKEFDAKVRDEEARRKNGTTKERGTDLVSGSRATRIVADTTTSGSALQKTQTQSTQMKEKYGNRSVEPASHLNGSAHNGVSHSGHLMHPNAFGTAWNKKVKDGDCRAAPSRTTSTVRGPNGLEFKAQRSYMPRGGGEELAFLSGLVSARTSAKSDNHRERSKQHHWPEHRLDVTEASEMQEWTNQIIDIPSTSRNDGERIIVKEPNMGYGANKNRIHYSGPLMLPGGNLEEMLKEHERQIQQAVRKARLDKAKTKKNIADQRPV